MNILFITANRLGDAVLSTGILDALIAQNPGAAITIACGPLPAPLFATVPGLAEIIVLAKRKRHGHWIDLWRRTVGTGWDLVVDLRNSAVSRLIGARRRLIFRGGTQAQHMVEAFSSLLSLDRPAAPRLWLDPGAVAAVAGTRPAGRLLAIAPGAASPGKRWPAERFAALAETLTGPAGRLAGAAVAVLGTEEERATARPILAAIPEARRIDLIGRTAPPEAAAWLAVTDLYIGNDSGLTHLAAAAGAPTLALFGPGLPGRYRPWGASARYLIAEEAPTRTLDLNKLGTDIALAEMEKLTLETVLVATERLIEETGRM